MTITVPEKKEGNSFVPDLPEGVGHIRATRNSDGTVTVTLSPDSAREWRLKEMVDDFDSFLADVGNSPPNAMRDIARDLSEERKGRRQG